jgi:hypothetical protein
MLIFAFGSNLCEQQMLQRCPSCELVDKAFLDDYRLAFGSFSHGWGGGVATVALARGHKVRGVLYRLSKRDLAKLDRHEGCPFQYVRVAGFVRMRRKMIKANWYVLTTDKPFAPPSAAYLAVISRRYRQLRFSRKALRAALVFTRDQMLLTRQKQCELWHWDPATNRVVAGRPRVARKQLPKAV